MSQLTELNNKVGSLDTRLARMEGMLGQFIDNANKNNAHRDDKLKDHEQRLRTGEADRNQRVGKASILGVVVAFVTSLATVYAPPLFGGH